MKDRGGCQQVDQKLIKLYVLINIYSSSNRIVTLFLIGMKSKPWDKREFLLSLCIVTERRYTMEPKICLVRFELAIMEHMEKFKMAPQWSVQFHISWCRVWKYEIKIFSCLWDFPPKEDFVEFTFLMKNLGLYNWLVSSLVEPNISYPLNQGMKSRFTHLKFHENSRCALLQKFFQIRNCKYADGICF